MPHIFSVRELIQGIKEVLETEFPFIWVKGQVGTISRPTSGHLYFALQDCGPLSGKRQPTTAASPSPGSSSWNKELLNVVWFKSQQHGPLSLAPERLQTGIEMVCAGKINVYPPKGSLQLLAEVVQEAGPGKFLLEFEALKRSLKAKGFFALENKKPLPALPKRIGVITAPHGAAIRDFLKISSQRGTGAMIRIYPSLVQGAGAAENLAWAIEQANLEGWAQILVLIRGGGSLEDLWVFNQEEVAQAIFASKIPILTGIGHETDQTIADLVADQRAATPSHAAQLLLPERDSLWQRIDELETQLRKELLRQLQAYQQRLTVLSKALLWLSPREKVERAVQRCQEVQHRLYNAGQDFLENKSSLMHNLIATLINFFGTDFFKQKNKQLTDLHQQSYTALQASLKQRMQQVQLLEYRLGDLNPARPLEHGFCLVTVDKNNKLLRSASQVSPGDLVNIRTRKDLLKARIVT